MPKLVAVVTTLPADAVKRSARSSADDQLLLAANKLLAICCMA
jgi:hypothetical protein